MPMAAQRLPARSAAVSAGLLISRSGKIMPPAGDQAEALIDELEGDAGGEIVGHRERADPVALGQEHDDLGGADAPVGPARARLAVPCFERKHDDRSADRRFTRPNSRALTTQTLRRPARKEMNGSGTGIRPKYRWSGLVAESA